MKYWLSALLLATSTFGATAPDSVAGKVFRDTQYLVSVRTDSESTIVFGGDGRFTYLKAGSGSPLILGNPGKIFVGLAPSDGSYSYTRTDDTTATLTLNSDDGTARTLVLQFTSADGGTDAGYPYSSFSLSDPWAGTTASASNVSMRGHVDADHPLIVGFVVPGTPPTTTGPVPPPGFQQREVLIRLVGPSLAQLGVTNGWVDPNFTLYQGNKPATPNEVHYDDWAVEVRDQTSTPKLSPAAQAGFQKIFNYVGAFPLLAGSKDSADVVRLNPGAYTIVAAPAAGDPGGECLIEVYFLP